MTEQPQRAPPADPESVQPATPGTAEPPGVGPSGGRGARNTTLRTRILMGVLALGLGWFAVWLYDRLTHLYIDDARVAADIVAIASKVSGWIAEMPVNSGNRVEIGDLLLRIDDREARDQLAQAEAELAATEAELVALKAEREVLEQRLRSRLTARRSEYESAKARLEASQSMLELARQAFERTSTLESQQMLSRQLLDQRRSELEAAGQGLAEVESALARAAGELRVSEAELGRVGVLDARIQELSHRVEAERSKRDQRRLLLEQHRVLSPVSGVVDEIFTHAGEYVFPGQRLLMLHDPERLWVRLNIKETDIRYVHPGDAVKIRVDAFPGETFSGRVRHIGRATTNQFALLPNPNPSGNFTKITQRLKVLVNLDRPDPRLAPGMMVEAIIERSD